MPTKTIGFLLILLTFSHMSFAQDRLLGKVYKSYKEGDFVTALAILKKYQPHKKENISIKSYLNGLANAKLQKYYLATIHFREALRLKNRSEDLFYEYGQALYAMNDLEKASKMFYKSLQRRFKPAVSLYYIAHIYQILEEYKKSKLFYSKVLKSKNADSNLKQVARFQRAEVLLSLSKERKNRKRIVKKFILPKMRKAFKINKTSSLGKNIKVRIKEVEAQFGLDPNIMINGRKISKKRYSLYFKGALSYDNNISLKNDQASIQTLKKDSYLNDSTFFSKYKLVFNQRYIIAPDLRLNQIRYQNRQDEDIYSNDEYNIQPALRFQFEHKIAQKMSSFLFDLEYKYTARDIYKNKEKHFSARSKTITFGEKIKYFSFGETTLKYKVKNYLSYDEALHNDTNSFSISQIGIIPGNKILLFFWQNDEIDTFNNEAEKTSSNLIRLDYIYPELFPFINLNLGFSLTLLSYEDILKSADNGTEKTYNPSIKLTKKSTKNLSLSIEYSYTNTTSLNIDNEYTKHLTTTELKYNF